MQIYSVQTDQENMIVGSQDCTLSIWELLENEDSQGYSKKNVYWVNKIIINMVDIDLAGKEILLMEVIRYSVLNKDTEAQSL